jgi:diguanylate cyclase
VTQDRAQSESTDRQPAELYPLGAPDQPRTLRPGEATLASKLTLLVLVALAVGVGLGVGVGLARPGLSAGLIVLLAVVALAAIVLLAAAGGLLNRPIDRLVQQSERIARTPERAQLRQLPTRRTDELGRIARALHNLAAAGYRDRQEAIRLRRTLDDRIARATRRQTSHLEQIALRDALTRLGNRRCLDQRLPEMIDQSRSTGDALLCVMMDLDDFKAVNDTLGHQTGDELLKVLGQLLEGSIRGEDLAVRLGGDEFAILMPGATIERGEQLTESLRNLLRQHVSTTMPEAPAVDISAGLAVLREIEGGDASALLAKADQRLYQAKQAGKGCTAVPPADAGQPGQPHARAADQPITAASIHHRGTAGEAGKRGTPSREPGDRPYSTMRD